MINFENNKGVTLVMLIVTIVVLFIIAGVTITASIDSIDQTIDSQDISEMLIVQHAMQQRYKEYLEKKDSNLLVGKQEGDYYIISNSQKLSELLPENDYYIKFDGEQRILYYINDGIPTELNIYKNTIINKEQEIASCTEEVTVVSKKLEGSVDCKMIKDNGKIKINSVKALGITALDGSTTSFKINYETGYVEKIGVNSQPLRGYNSDTSGNTTSYEININNTAV